MWRSRSGIIKICWCDDHSSTLDFKRKLNIPVDDEPEMWLTDNVKVREFQSCGRVEKTEKATLL